MYPVVVDIRKRIRERIRGQLLGQSAPMVLVSDDFNDGEINLDIWEKIKSVSGMPGCDSSVVEIAGRLRVHSEQVGCMSGVALLEPVEINNGVIQIQLEQSNFNATGITLLPDGADFYMEASPDAYSYILWNPTALSAASIRRNGDIVHRHEHGNPVNVEIQVRGGEIIFFQNGVEIYREAYQISSTNCRIYLWGVSWYLNVPGLSYFEDFIVETALPELTIAVDKSTGYLGEIFAFSGFLNDPFGAPMQDIIVNLVKRKVVQEPTIYPMPDAIQFPYTMVECYTGKDNQISPCAEIWHYAANIMVDIETWMSPALGQEMFASRQECRDSLDVSYPLGSPENAGTDLTDLGGAYDIPWTADEKGTFQFYSETVI